MSDHAAKQRFISLRAQGHTYSQIAAELGKSKQTLISWSKELESEISNLRAIELESLREQFMATKKARIKTLGQLTRIDIELQNRDMASVPTDKLMDMAIKLSTRWIKCKNLDSI